MAFRSTPKYSLVSHTYPRLAPEEKKQYWKKGDCEKTGPARDGSCERGKSESCRMAFCERGQECLGREERDREEDEGGSELETKDDATAASLMEPSARILTHT